MGEEEDGIAPGPSMSTLGSLTSPQNTYGNRNHQFDVNLPYHSPSRQVDESFQYPTSSSNPDFSDFPEFPENIGSTYSDAADDILFDIDEDLEGTTVVPDDDVRIDATRSGMEFTSEKELMAYYKKFAKQEGFGVRTQRTKRDDAGSYIQVYGDRKFQKEESLELKCGLFTKEVWTELRV